VNCLLNIYCKFLGTDNLKHIVKKCNEAGYSNSHENQEVIQNLQQKLVRNFGLVTYKSQTFYGTGLSGGLLELKALAVFA